jgi:hypothetical protein
MNMIRTCENVGYLDVYCIIFLFSIGITNTCIKNYPAHST